MTDISVETREEHSWMGPAALALGILAVIIAYYPVLAPLLDGKLAFTYGDFWTPYGENSASIRSEETFYTFRGGANQLVTNRFYPLAALSALSNVTAVSDSQLISALILASAVLGCIGLYEIAGLFVQDRRYRSAAILALILFYFLNLWGVERIGHIWIWFAYAIFPMFLGAGLRFVKEGRASLLIAYSLLISFFGVMPHAFIYLMFFHGFVVVFAYLSKMSASGVCRLAIVPLIAYAAINLPSLTLSESVGGAFVSAVHSDSVGLLSRNGELANLFAFSNNWWHQISSEIIYKNPAFTYSSIGIFSCVFLAFGLCLGRMGRDGRVAAMLALAGLLAVIFVAQGAKNGILAPVLDAIAKSDFSVILRPLREWARISLLAPPLMAIILSACMNDRRWRLPITAGFFILIAVNIAFSPAWAYFYDVHTATHVPDELRLLQEKAGNDSKDIWPGVYGKSLPVLTASGEPRDTNTYLRYISGVRRGYGSGFVSDYEKRSSWKVMPQPLMDALNIRDVVLMDAKGASEWYGWMDCSDLGGMTLCHDANASAPLRIYDGAIASRPDAMEPLSHIRLENYAITGENISFGEYCATWNGMECGDSHGGGIYLIEAETGLNGKRSRFNSPFASNRTAVYFTGNLTARFDAPKSGFYGIALLGNGSFHIRIGGNNISLQAEDGGYAISEPVHLEEGIADISIRRGGRGDSLDALIIFTAGNGTAYSPFATGTAPPARITGYTKTDPTRWRVNISAQKPFLLAFAETYDGRWMADVYKDGRLIGAKAPISLYDAMNGYWVEETGELEVRLRYEPQERYEWAMLASMAAIAACAGLLALAVWKEGAHHGKA